MSDANKSMPTARRTSSPLGGRSAYVLLALLFMVPALLGVAAQSGGSPGDFDVSAPNLRAGAATTYTVTYFAERTVPQDYAFRVTFPSDEDFNGFRMDPNDPDAVQHDYSKLTHQWSIFRSEENSLAGDEYFWNVQFNVTRSIQAGERITFTVDILSNPSDPDDYIVEATLREGAFRSTVGTSTDTVAITFAAPGEGEVIFDLPNRAGGTRLTGDLLVRPEASTSTLDVTLPFAFEVREANLRPGWTVVQDKQEPNPLGFGAEPWIIRYSGSALDGGQVSRIPFGEIDVTPYTGNFTFEFLERQANGAQVRDYDAQFEVVTNVIDVDYTTAAAGRANTGSTHVLRQDIAVSNTLAENDRLIIRFPAGFDLSQVSANDIDLEGEVNGDPGVVADGGTNGGSTQINAQQRTITFTMGEDDEIPDGVAAHLIVRDLIAPKAIGPTDEFQVHTLDQEGRNMDRDASLKFEATAHGTLRSFSLTGGSVPGPTDAARSGQSGRLVFSGQLDTGGPASLRFYFPDGYAVSAGQSFSAKVSEGSSQADATVTVDAAKRTVTVSLSGLDLDAGDSINGTLTGFRHPVVLGSYPFTLRTISSAGAELDSVSAAVDVTAVQLTGIIVNRANDDLGGSGQVTLEFQHHGLLTSGARLRVALSDGYQLSTTNVRLNGITIATDDMEVVGGALLILIEDHTEVDSAFARLQLGRVTNPPLRPSVGSGGTATVDILAGGSSPVASGSTTLDALVLPANAPSHLYLTADSIEAANRLIQVTATETADGVRVSWVLPADQPKGNGQVVPPAGVQVWSSQSPYTLLATYEDGDGGFESRQHLDEDGDGDTRYLVTMFFADGIGRYDGGDDAPDTDDYDGAAVDAPDRTWLWVVIGIGALLVIVLVAVLVVRARGDRR